MGKRKGCSVQQRLICNRLEACQVANLVVLSTLDIVFAAVRTSSKQVASGVLLHQRAPHLCSPLKVSAPPREMLLASAHMEITANITGLKGGLEHQTCSITPLELDLVANPSWSPHPMSVQDSEYRRRGIDRRVWYL